MIQELPHTGTGKTLVAAFAALFAISCGSYQQASYYEDGIYASEERVAVNRPAETPQRSQEQSVYGDYFGQKAEEYGEILEGEVFTDVDSYYGGVEGDSLAAVQPDTYYGENNTYDGYAGWGDNSESVVVNVYDSWGWGGFGFGLGYPWLYGGNFGYGWNYSPWGFRGFDPFWGYGYAGYYGFGYGYGFGWGGYYPYASFNHPYYYPYYYNNGYTFNRGRRGYYGDRAIAGNSLRGRSSSGILGRDNARYRTNSGRSNIDQAGARSSSAYRSGTTLRRSVGVDAAERNRNYRSSRTTRALPRYDGSSRSNQTYRGNSTGSGTYGRSASGSRVDRAYTPRTSAPSRNSGTVSPGRSSQNSGYRSSGSSSPSRSSGYRSSSGSSTRSSGAIRSSGGASRSSGVRSSGGGGGRSNGSRNQ